MTIFKRLQHWLRRRRFDQFREWYQMHEQAKQWIHGRCRYCQAPLVKDALFCSQCGMRLDYKPEQEVHTESLQAQLPLGARQKALNRWSAPQTQQIPRIQVQVQQKKERQR